MDDKIIDTPETISESIEIINYPGLKDRIQSTIIDSIAIVILIFLFSMLFDSIGPVSDNLRFTAFIFVFGIFEPLCTTLGATPGNLASGLRVRQFNNPDKKINFFMALIRYIVKVMLGIVSFFTIHSNKEKRAIHDFAADSVVIYIKNN